MILIQQKLMALEQFPEPGEFEEIRLSDNDYDASKSSITISCLTENVKKEHQWGPYRHYGLKRVSYLET